MLNEFYEKNLKGKKEFDSFIYSFLEEILPENSNVDFYRESALEYLFYEKNDFLYKLKYQIFRQVDSNYLNKLFNSFREHNPEWVKFIWNCCENKDNVKKVITFLGNKKIEVLQTITMPSFKSLENDVQNSEIVTNMLNSIVEHLQQMQKNQNMMLANISHEMRTPLNSVIGYLDVLDSINNLSIDDRKNITFAKNSSKLLLTLINDLLDTQKLANASLDLIHNPFWINRIIKNAISISSVNANQKNLEFIYIDKTAIFNEVVGDKNRFLQILNNLFSNAIKFTPEKGRVEIVTNSEDLGDSIKICISVKDTGIGIAKDKQKELFKPFSRATNREKGTGLGLYISKQLANRMDGDIWFESEENKGSTFYLELKFKKSKNLYEKNILKNRKIIFLKDKNSLDYCKNLFNQLTELGSKVKMFNDENKFMQFLMFNKDIDMAVIIYPNKIEKDDLDESFIKTYRKMNQEAEKKTLFVAGIDENYYPKNSKMFDKIVNTPITVLEIVESFSSIKSSVKNLKYLIIDDEPMNRMVLSTMIKTFDKSAIIETANNGVVGLEKIVKNKYDIIFLDKRMPKMDGYEVLEKLKFFGIKANIYLLTADGDNETISKAREYEVGYIAKPVTLSTLKAIVGNISSSMIFNDGGGGSNILV